MKPVYNFYNLCGLYTNGLIHSYSLAEVIRETPDLTVNPTRTSGFNEIDVDLQQYAPDMNEIHDILNNPFLYLNRLHDGFLHRLRNVSNSKEIWMGLSAGKDTRILLKLLQQFKRDQGVDVDRIQFFSYEPEHVHARAILKECQLSVDNLHIYREDRVKDVDYYRLAEYPANPNGNFCPEIEYFEPGFKYGDKVFIWGSGGNELTFYPSSPTFKQKFSNNIAYFLKYTYFLRGQHYEKYHKWGEIIEPYFYIPYMESIFNLPPECFVELDGLRDRMLKSLGGTKIPVILGHDYNYHFSEETITRIYTQFINSQFVKDFNPPSYITSQIANMIGEIKQFRKMEMGLVGLAMVYEHAMKDRVNADWI